RWYDRALGKNYNLAGERLRRVRVEAEEVLGLQDSALAHHGRGLYLKARGLPDDAIEAFRRAIQIDRNLGGAHRHLADALLRTGRLEEGLAEYEETIRIKRDNAYAYDGLAWALATRPEARLRDPGRAVEAARRAVELDPKQMNFWQTLGWAEYRA